MRSLTTLIVGTVLVFAPAVQAQQSASTQEVVGAANGFLATLMGHRRTPIRSEGRRGLPPRNDDSVDRRLDI